MERWTGDIPTIAAWFPLLILGCGSTKLDAMTPARLVWLLVVAAPLLGCATPQDSSVIDGWEIGPSVSCDVYEPPTRCQALVPFAVRAFDRFHPGHAPIDTATLHEWLPARDRVYSGGPPQVVVIELADGTIRATGVDYFGVSSLPTILEMGGDGEPRIVCQEASCP